MLELSTTPLDDWRRCRRKFYYRTVLGWRPRTVSKPMMLGSGFHFLMQGGYNGIRALTSMETIPAFLTGARSMLTELRSRDGHYERYGEQHQLVFTEEEWMLIDDMMLYYVQKKPPQYRPEDILAVEQPLYLHVGGFRIRCTFDLIARNPQAQIIEATDHKTVGDIDESTSFLPLDQQLLLQELIATEQHTIAKHGLRFEVPVDTPLSNSTAWADAETIEVVYNMVRRELPPDFTREDGSKPYGKTKTGKESKRNADVSKYLSEYRIGRDATALAAFRKSLEDDIEEVLQAEQTGRYPRSPVKGNVGGCKFCAYNSPCVAELQGKDTPLSLLGEMYHIEPKDVHMNGIVLV